MTDQSVHFPIYDIEGDPESMGLSYGRQAQARIEESLDIYRPIFEQLGLTWDQVLERASGFLEQLSGYDAEAAQELDAIARGAGVRPEEITAINARTDILYAAPRTPEEVEDGCTGAIALPSATADGHLIHGQNWDWRDRCKRSVVIIRARPQGHPATLGLMEAGTLARCGLNEHGIALTANFLRCQWDPGQSGVPSPFIRRKLLRQSQFSTAMETIATAQRSFSNNFMLSHASGLAVDLETTPREYYWIKPKEGLLVHANHFVSQAAAARVFDTGLSLSADSIYRDDRVMAALRAQQGKITVQTMIDALADDFAAPASVNRPPTLGPGGKESSTVATIVMDVTTRSMTVVPTPYTQSESRTYSLD